MSENVSRPVQWLATLQPFGMNERDLHLQLSSLMSHKFNPLDLIFSCNVCGETLDSIYSESDGNQGLRSTPASENGSVVKLWLTECAHLTCAKHLEGGGVPFHPSDQPPRALCPICNEEREDVTPKKLYAVHGLRDGEFDPQIPASYMEFPPPGLDASNPNMEGARFQFVALWRYSTRLRKRLDQAERSRDNLQSRLDEQELKVSRMSAVVMTEQSDKDELHIMMVNLGREHDELMEQKAFLERKVEDLEQEVKQWDHWKARQAEITAYLNLLAPLARAHLAMREQLWGLGLDLPDTEDAMQVFGPRSIRLPGPHRFSPERSPDNVAVERSGVIASGNGTGVGRILTRSLAVEEQDMSNQAAAPFAIEDIIEQARSRPNDPDKKQYMYGMKRQHSDTTDASTLNNISLSGIIQRRRLLESRDMMPPPPLPPRVRLEEHPFYSGTLTSASQGFTTPHRHGNDQQAALHEGSTALSNQAFQRPTIASPSLRRRPGSRNLAANRALRRPSDEEIDRWGIHRSRTRDRSHEFGTSYASPSILTALSTWQDGELDNVARGGRQQPPPSPSPFPPSSSSQRLTLPPTTSRTHGITPSRRGGPGLSANVRTSSSPVVYGPPPTSPPRRPLPSLPIPIGSGSRQQVATGATSPFFTPRAPAAARTVAPAPALTTPSRNPPFLADPRLSVAAAARDDDDDADDEAGRLFSRSGRRGVRR